jgi:hypothetical protein
MDLVKEKEVKEVEELTEQEKQDLFWQSQVSFEE